MTDNRLPILWVDDDFGFIQSQVEELSHIWPVVAVSSADSCWQKLVTEGPDHFIGIIMDILLPYGTIVTAEKANGGLRTGLALIDQIKSTQFSGIPIVVFTIRSSTDVDEFCARFDIPVVRKHESLDEFIETTRKAFKI